MSKEEPATARLYHRPHADGLCRDTFARSRSAAITAAMRAMVSSSKGAGPGIEARGQFDTLIESVLPRGGVPGLWVHPADWRSAEAIVHLHGGWFNFGSAKAYRHLVGHFTARAGEGVYPGL
ncbi:MAG: hypothetical protein WBW14_05115 [Candidatus Acidiferrum sp.]